MNERIYFISTLDGEIHNIGDRDYIISEDGESAEIGEMSPDGLRVDEEVNLWTIQEVLKFYE